MVFLLHLHLLDLLNGGIGYIGGLIEMDGSELFQRSRPRTDFMIPENPTYTTHQKFRVDEIGMNLVPS